MLPRLYRDWDLDSIGTEVRPLQTS
jgi:hypothetical protein